jgi:murein DD-endopeptidase MepM/ murein hydrolase activator NlpD
LARGLLRTILEAMATTVAPLLLLLLTLAYPTAGPAPSASSVTRQQATTRAVWPLHPTPTVVSGFAPPLSPYGAGHRGVDLAGRAEQPVRAAADGRVTFAGSLAGRGVVVVSHGRTRTTYEPVDASVAVGETVTAGDRLGTLQATGSHCMPEVCLHWGLLEGDTYLDPLTLVGAGPVRLLPLDGSPPVGQARGWAWR